MPRVRQSRTGEMGSRRSRTALSPSELFRLVRLPSELRLDGVGRKNALTISVPLTSG
jgi:hypothetical protein